MNLLTEIVEKHTKTQPNEYPTALREREQTLSAECDLLAKCEGSLLAVEKNSKETIQKRLRSADAELKKLQLRRLLMEQGFPILDPEPFRMRNEKGLPKLALFSVDSDICRFQFSSLGRFYYPSLPRIYDGVWHDIELAMAKSVTDTVRVIKRRSRIASLSLVFVVLAFLVAQQVQFGVASIGANAFGGVILLCFWFVLHSLDAIERGVDFSLVYSVKFSGLIPPEKREKIKTLMKAGGRVSLLAEVDEWGKSIKTDPLILISDEERFYVAGSFDTTTLEDYIAKEFVR